MRIHIISIFFLITISISLFMVPVNGEIPFSGCSNKYQIRGELCYDDFANTFVGSYEVEGWLELSLTPLNTASVSYRYELYQKNLKTDYIFLHNQEEGILTDRMKSDGNYTGFFSEMPYPATQQLHTLTETVEAQYIGIRYIDVKGRSIKTHCYIYVLAALHNIYRCLWYFDVNSGVLLRLFKSIEVNLLQVQWIDYLIDNTSLALTENSHPIKTFFTNHNANIFAIIGAVGVIFLCFFVIIQKKVGRTKVP